MTEQNYSLFGPSSGQHGGVSGLRPAGQNVGSVFRYPAGAVPNGGDLFSYLAGPNAGDVFGYHAGPNRGGLCYPVGPNGGVVFRYPNGGGGVFGYPAEQNGSHVSGCQTAAAPSANCAVKRQFARENDSGVIGSSAGPTVWLGREVGRPRCSGPTVWCRGVGPNGSLVFGSSAPQPTSREDETTVADKKVKKEANRYPILNSPLPVILVSRTLKGIPQSPHFLQLRCYSATARKNLEAAWDQTFEEAVEQIHELRASDFWAMARKLWKTMEELQSLGYNVFVPRKRVVELTDAMLKQNKRRNEIMVLKARAELHRLEKSRLESAIRNLKAQARSAQDKMMESLIEVADKEKDLPEIENQIVDLASQPLKKHKLA